MKKLIESRWQDILNSLIKDHEITSVAVSTWIKPLKVQQVEGDTVTFYMERGSRGIPDSYRRIVAEYPAYGKP